MSGYYRSLTLSHTQAGSTDTADYPCFWAGNASLATIANGGRVTSSSGYDIVFCTNPASPLTSKLPFERVAWSATTGLGEFWIQIPTLSHSTDTVVYCYYGDATIITDQQNANGTWDSNYVAVYHFGAASSLTLTDSTSNANNGTNHGATGAVGLLGGGVGGALHFTAASSQYVDCGNGSSLNITSAISVEVVVNTDSLPGSGVFPRAVSKTLGSGAFPGYEVNLHDSTGAIAHEMYYQANGGNGGSMPGGTQQPLVVGNIYYFSFTNTAVASTGNALGSKTTFSDTCLSIGNTVSVPTTTTSHLFLGQFASGSQFWDGYLDEVRVSNVARSVSYQTASFNNISSGSTFVSVGSETPVGGGGGLLVNPGDSGGMQLLQGGCNA